MAKPNKQRAPKAPASAAPADATPAVEVKPAILVVVKKDAKFRGARDAWYARLKEYDGKPVQDYVNSCKVQPPEVPKSGRAENPTGWVSYFKRQGIVEVRTGA